MLLLLWSLGACTTQNNTDKPTVAVQTDPVLTKLNEAIRKNPDKAEHYVKRSNWYRKQQMDSLALQDLYQAVKIDSGEAAYHSAIADILFDHKDITGSVQWIQKAIALNPNDKTAHLKMARMFLYTEEYPKAFIEINTVLRQDVYHAEAYFLKGMCYKLMKDSTKAISSFQTAVQSDPMYAEAHMQLALIFAARKNPLALQYFQNAWKADTLNLEPLYGKGMFWQDQENFAEAKKIFKALIVSHPQYERSYYNLGWIYLQEDSLPKAIRHFTMATQVKQGYTEAWYNRGLCYELSGKLDSARADYSQALNFDPEYSPAREALQRVQAVKK